MLTRQTADITHARREFEWVVRRRAVQVAFQPIVHIESGTIVGYEALARGPAGSTVASPAALFAEAYRAGRQDELDWICRAAAIGQALAADLPDTTPLFINVEPRSLGSDCPEDLIPAVAAATGRLRIVLEVTERSIATDPARLLAATAEARRQSIGLALDDVGADPTSLAMMPLLVPDVIKLDLSLIQARPTMAVAQTVDAVLAQAEHTGAVILAEGVESRRHIEVAQSLGATLAQGWHYGRPGPLRHRGPGTEPSIDLLSMTTVAATTTVARTPFEAILGRRTSRATQRLLLPMSMHLEYKGLDLTETTMLLACLPRGRQFSVAARKRYGRVASRGVFTAVLGVDMPPEPEPQIRGGRLDPDDPLAREWSVIVLGPHFAGALIAREHDRGGPDDLRRFDFLITHDRDAVIAAARPLLNRLLPA